VFQRSKKLALLEKIPLFRDLSRKQIAQIERLVDEITVPAGSRLATTGQHGAELVVIVEGRASVTVGRRRTVRLGPGDFFGEMSLVDGGPRSATVEAASDMRLLVIGGREFSELLEKAPPIVVKIMQVLSRRVREAEASVSA
jgi:CRP-like cAMP-binding protein